jgi:hypothetical protein
MRGHCKWLAAADLGILGAALMSSARRLSDLRSARENGAANRDPVSNS